jgi:hypothetical protein
MWFYSEMETCCSYPNDLAQTQQWFLELERTTCIGERDSLCK